MEKQKVKEPPYHIFFLFLGCLVCLFLIQPYLFEEILNSLFKSEDSIIVSAQISPKNSVIDIGILVIVEEETNLNEYRQALASVECYARIHKYGFRLERITHYWRSQCDNKDIKFLRHCILSKLIKTHEWTLFLSPDNGIINPHRFIEEFIVDTSSNIIFFDKISTWEISSDSYLARNTTFAAEFLIKFAQLEFQLPQSFHGSDNEAIHWLFLQQFYSNTSTSNLSPTDCGTIWSASNTFDDLEIFKACCQHIFGEKSHFCVDSDCVTLLPKRKAWIRDGTITDSKWSTESDFMFSGWKESYRIPTVEESDSWTRASQRLLSASWYSPLGNTIFDKEACNNGTILWQWYHSFLISNIQLNKLLDEVQNKAQGDFLKAVSSIPNFL